MLTRERVEEIHQELGVPKDKGCIMIDTETVTVRKVIPQEDLYYAQDTDNFKYVAGIVSEDVPHVTLLYGLIKSGQEWKGYVNEALDGIAPDEITIREVSYFESQVETEPYYVLVAHIYLTEELKQARTELCKILPHVTDFYDYKPHLTLAYIRKDETARDKYVATLNEQLAGGRLRVKGVNYGD